MSHLTATMRVGLPSLSKWMPDPQHQQQQANAQAAARVAVAMVAQAAPDPRIWANYVFSRDMLAARCASWHALSNSADACKHTNSEIQ